MQPIRFTIRGEITPQGRPKAAVIGGHARVYDPKRSREFKNFVRLEASRHAPVPPLDGQLAVTLDIYRPIPKAFSHKKVDAALAGQLRPSGKPDVENLAKSLMDGMSKIIYTDDARIVDLHVRKWYGNAPRAEVEVRAI